MFNRKYIQPALLSALLFCSVMPSGPAIADEIPSYASSGEHIAGRVSTFDGEYSLEVRDDRGFLDNVRLHPGTIINPTGLTLTSGMVVSILGENEGDVFAADEIDTPYTYQNGVPCYAGHPWSYFGSGVALGLFFATTAWWYGGYHVYHGYSHWGYGGNPGWGHAYGRPYGYEHHGAYRPAQWHGSYYHGSYPAGGGYPYGPHGYGFSRPATGFSHSNFRSSTSTGWAPNTHFSQSHFSHGSSYHGSIYHGSSEFHHSAEFHSNTSFHGFGFHGSSGGHGLGGSHH